MSPPLLLFLHARPPRGGARLALALAAAGVCLLAGCSTPQFGDTVIGRSYQPANVYRPVWTLPSHVRRVAVLPLTGDAGAEDFAAGREILEPALQEEVAKIRRFEAVLVTPEELRLRTGQPGWNTRDKLPANLFEMLKAAYGCDAVLFSQVTVFRGYPPLAVGWRLRLVESRGAQTLWAADEVFDAGQTAVVNGARRYQQRQQRDPSAYADSRSILDSPRRFAHYTAGTLLHTLPER